VHLLKPLVLLFTALLLSACGGGGGGAFSSSVSEKSEPSLADFWEGSATFRLDNIPIAEDLGLHFISGLWFENTLYTYFVQSEFRNNVEVFTTHLALSEDGLNFTPVGKVLDAVPPTERIASFSDVWIDEGVWHLVYEGAPLVEVAGAGGIYLATSTNGQEWSIVQPAILTPSADWERINIGTPSLFKEKGVWYVFYHGYDGQKLKIGLAAGEDLTRLVYLNDHQPVLSTGDSWDSATVGRRSIIRQGSYYYMVYEGSTAATSEKGFSGAEWSSGLARSKDLIVWEKYPENPILPVTNTGFGFDGPDFVVTKDSVLHIYFRTPRGGTSRATLGPK
jgi:hypothetical protein